MTIAATTDNLINTLTLLAGDQWELDTEATWNADYNRIAISTEQPADFGAVNALLRALFGGPLRGEWWDGAGEEVVPGHLFIFSVDTTKIGRDDAPDAWGEFRHWLSEGSPIRTTDRAGAGTKGTRKYAGLGPVQIAWGH